MVSRVLRYEDSARWDALLVALALLHGGLLAARPSIALIAVGLWWNANTISHNFVHRPFFRTRALNAGFSCYLTLLLGFPQSMWRARHLAHHGVRSRFTIEPVDVGAAIILWGALLVFAPGFALAVCVPGFVIGLGLCFLQGRYEHARGTVSHYGRLYNLLFFNDGYHAEHHARPSRHWRDLPARRAAEPNTSRWPAVLRWLECVNLCGLERLVLRSSLLQRFVLNRHERALRKLLPEAISIRRVGIVGGGLFPRTAIILRRLLPGASLTLIDMSAENIAVARGFLGDKVDFVRERFEAAMSFGYDLVLIPLAFVGDREAIYRRPPAPVVLIHDWIWRRKGSSVVVSWLLLKRLNLVKR